MSGTELTFLDSLLGRVQRLKEEMEENYNQQAALLEEKRAEITETLSESENRITYLIEHSHGDRIRTISAPSVLESLQCKVQCLKVATEKSYNHQMAILADTSNATENMLTDLKDRITFLIQHRESDRLREKNFERKFEEEKERHRKEIHERRTLEKEVEKERIKHERDMQNMKRMHEIEMSNQRKTLEQVIKDERQRYTEQWEECDVRITHLELQLRDEKDNHEEEIEEGRRRHQEEMNNERRTHAEHLKRINDEVTRAQPTETHQFSITYKRRRCNSKSGSPGPSNRITRPEPPEKVRRMQLKVTRLGKRTVRSKSAQYQVKSSARMIIDCLGSGTIGPPPPTAVVVAPLPRTGHLRPASFTQTSRILYTKGPTFSEEMEQINGERTNNASLERTNKSSLVRLNNSSQQIPLPSPFKSSTQSQSSGRIAFVDDVAVCPKTDDLYILGHLVNATTSSVICYSIDGYFLRDFTVKVQGDSHIAMNSDETAVVSDCKDAVITMYGTDRRYFGTVRKTLNEYYWTYLQGVACDSQNNVYVADRDTRTIYFYDETGTRIGQFGPGSSTGLSPHLTQPWGLALIDGDGGASFGFVTDLVRKNVVCFDIPDEEYAGQLGPKRDGIFNPERDHNPQAIAVWPLSDSDTDFEQEGTVELRQPKAVAFDKLNGVILASNNAKYGREGVEVFNIKGAHIGTIRDRVRKFKNIMGLAVTSKGDVVVADREQILVF